MLAQPNTSWETISMKQWIEIIQRNLQMPALSRPRLFLCTFLAVLITALICSPVWPGLMSYDSLYAYKQSIYGVESSWWPPMHDYFFFISRSLGLGVGGLFVFQTFTLFFGAGLILSTLIGRLGHFLTAFLTFVILFYYFPTMLGASLVIWKDVLMTSMGLLGVALWLIAVRSSSRIALLSGILSVSIAVSLRHNSLPLYLPCTMLMVIHPLGRETRNRGRIIASIAVVTGLLGAYASTIWRLPDLKKLPAAMSDFSTIQMWDLIGISACADKNLLPPSFSVDGALTGPEIRAIYDPRHINLTLEPPTGLKRLKLPATDTSAELSAAWKASLRTNTRCYLWHRASEFSEQMGLVKRGVFYPTHGGIDPNPYGLHLANPRAAAFITRYVVYGADQWWGRPFILYLLAGLIVIIAFLLRPARGACALISVGRSSPTNAFEKAFRLFFR